MTWALIGQLENAFTADHFKFAAMGVISALAVLILFSFIGIIPADIPLGLFLLTSGSGLVITASLIIAIMIGDVVGAYILGALFGSSG